MRRRVPAGLCTLGALGALGALTPAPAVASPDSFADLAWRGDGVPGPPPRTLAAAAVDFHSNHLVRGMAIFHRPGDDLLAQKPAVTAELRARPTAPLEVTWSTAFALFDREGTRAEVPHAESVQELRARWGLQVADRLWLAPSAALLVDIPPTESVRAEAGLTAGWSRRVVDLEAQVLHHQALIGEPASEVVLSYAHVQASRAFQLGGHLLIPYLRASGEARTTAPADDPAWAGEAGLLASWRPGDLPVRLLWSLRGLYRGDLGEGTLGLSLGLQGLLGAGP